ncbi:DUF2244 domain-containing protein, partial [Alphaproteobacteria bacterium]|nr:DUF2244 domain-containing protein [Alphaproteobacteria bacterium]
MSENQTESQPLERLTIWPHRSLSPKGFAIVIGVLAGLLFTIGLGFFLAGAWPDIWIWRHYHVDLYVRLLGF